MKLFRDTNYNLWSASMPPVDFSFDGGKKMEERKKVRIAIACSLVEVGKNATFKYVNDYTGNETGKAKYAEATVLVEAVSYARGYGLMKVESENEVFYVPSYNPYWPKNLKIGYAVTATSGKRVVYLRLIATGNNEVKVEYDSSEGEAQFFCNVDKNFIQVTTTKNEELFLEFPAGSNIRVSVEL